MSLWSRRKFFLTSLAGTAAAGTTNLLGAPGSALSSGNGTDGNSRFGQTAANKGKRPVIISSANGVHALTKGMDVLKSGGDTLDAAVAAVTETKAVAGGRERQPVATNRLNVVVPGMVGADTVELRPD